MPISTFTSNTIHTIWKSLTEYIDERGIVSWGNTWSWIQSGIFPCAQICMRLSLQIQSTIALWPNSCHFWADDTRTMIEINKSKWLSTLFWDWRIQGLLQSWCKCLNNVVQLLREFLLIKVWHPFDHQIPPPFCLLGGPSLHHLRPWHQEHLPCIGGKQSSQESPVITIAPVTCISAVMLVAKLFLKVSDAMSSKEACQCVLVCQGSHPHWMTGLSHVRCCLSRRVVCAFIPGMISCRKM